ncbi:MAG: hypothetical protein EA424_08645 [Planctomycetaceae bacterium]|nr:MAG: hypothetical protein EA424_08645 [Planctomycetaceae bacterium]
MIRTILCLLVVVLVGCGSGEQRDYVDHSRDPEAFAQNVKQLVVDSAARARTSEEPEDYISGIVDLLEDLGGRPTGAYRETYDQLLSLSREIVSECEAADGQRPPNLDQRLDELTALADELPGDAAPLPVGEN